MPEAHQLTHSDLRLQQEIHGAWNSGLANECYALGLQFLQSVEGNHSKTIKIVIKAFMELVPESFDGLGFEALRSICLASSAPYAKAFLGFCLLKDVINDKHKHDRLFLLNSMGRQDSFVFDIAMNASPGWNPTKADEKKTWDAFRVIWKDCASKIFPASTISMIKDIQARQDYWRRAARACLGNTKIYFANAYPEEDCVALGQFIVQESFASGGIKQNGLGSIPADKIHILRMDTVAHVLAPDGTDPQLHVVLDADLLEEKYKGHPCTKSGWKFAGFGDLEPDLVVCFVTYNLYGAGDAALINEFADIIKDSSAAHYPINRPSVSEAQGLLTGLTGLRVNRTDGKVGAWTYTSDDLSGSRHELAKGELAVGEHLLELLYGLWPEMAFSWRVLTRLAAAPGVNSGIAATAFSGISYISPVHLDRRDLLHTVGLVLKKNPEAIGDVASSAMSIPNRGVLIHTPPPCFYGWRSPLDGHTTTISPQAIECVAKGRNWQSIGLVCTMKSDVLRACRGGRLVESLPPALLQPDKNLIERLKARAQCERLDWDAIWRQLPNICGSHGLKAITRFDLEELESKASEGV